jgi:hypothetical protein
VAERGRDTSQVLLFTTIALLVIVVLFFALGYVLGKSLL